MVYMAAIIVVLTCLTANTAFKSSAWR
jgi:hypothetical protein